MVILDVVGMVALRASTAVMDGAQIALFVANPSRSGQLADLFDLARAIVVEGNFLSGLKFVSWHVPSQSS